MRRVTLRVSDELHELVTRTAYFRCQSLNAFATDALLAPVRTRSFAEWRQLIERSHRAARFVGMSAEGHELLRTLTGDETE